jgi:hypothetical protein
MKTWFFVFWRAVVRLASRCSPGEPALGHGGEYSSSWFSSYPVF